MHPLLLGDSYVLKGTEVNTSRRILQILCSLAFIVVECLPDYSVCQRLIMLVLRQSIVVLSLEYFLVIVDRADHSCCICESRIRRRHLTVARSTADS